MFRCWSYQTGFYFQDRDFVEVPTCKMCRDLCMYIVAALGRKIKMSHVGSMGRSVEIVMYDAITDACVVE